MSPLLTRFCRSMRDQGWRVEIQKSAQIVTRDSLPLARYPKLERAYLEFLASVKACASPDEKAWFWSLDDFNGRSHRPPHVRWDDIERSVLEGAEGDDEWTREAKEFWDRHCPIVRFAKTYNAFLAIDTATDGIVEGEEPEYGPSPMFESFVHLLESLPRIVAGEAPRPLPLRYLV